jgi:hypothetical protein
MTRELERIWKEMTGEDSRWYGGDFEPITSRVQAWEKEIRETEEANNVKEEKTKVNKEMTKQNRPLISCVFHYLGLAGYGTHRHAAISCVSLYSWQVDDDSCIAVPQRTKAYGSPSVFLIYIIFNDTASSSEL